jgi:gluconolactonase
MKKLKLQGREVTDGLRFPEGPIALPDGSVIVVEIAGGRLTRVHPDGKKTTISELGGGPNGAAIGPDGHCYVCNNGGFTWVEHPDGLLRPTLKAADYSGGRIERINLTTGKFERLYDSCAGEKLKGPNDIVFDKSGGFWFTDLGKVHERQTDRGAVYYATPDGRSVAEPIFPFVTPNGVGLSPDEKTVYVAETEGARLWAFGSPGHGQIKKQAWPSPNGGALLFGWASYRRFDSMAVEANGNICVATLIHGGISVISPQGELVEFWETPDPYCTNICFGGPDLRTAYITLSGYGSLLAVEWPRPGLPLNFLNTPSG